MFAGEDIKVEDMTARDLFEAVMEDLDDDNSDILPNDADSADAHAVLKLVGDLAIAQAIEKLAERIEDINNTYQINSVGG